METPNSVILISQYKTVSPRSPANSNFINDLVGQTGADLNNLKNQFNKLLAGVQQGVDETEAWINGHGLDAHSLFYDSTVTSGAHYDSTNSMPKSIHEVVGQIETTITELPNTLEIAADQVSFNTTGLGSTYENLEPANVQTVLEQVIDILGLNTDGGTIDSLNSNILNYNDHIIPVSNDTYNIGCDTYDAATDTCNAAAATTEKRWWLNGYIKNIHTDAITIGGVALTGDFDAASVTYDGIDASTSEPYKHYQDAQTPPSSVVANVKQALDLLGDLDSDPEFNRAGETLKGPMGNIVTTVVGTPGMTISQWLTALFFPFEPAVLSLWNVDTPKEKGTTLANHTCNWVVALNDGTITEIKVGQDNGPLSDTGTIAASGSHQFTGPFSTNTAFQIEITCDAETGTLSDSKKLEFFARYFYGHFPQLTNNGEANAAQILALLENGFDPSDIRNGFSYTFGPAAQEGVTGFQHLYMAIPTSYKVYLTAWQGQVSNTWKFVTDISNHTTKETIENNLWIPITDGNVGDYSCILPLAADPNQNEEYLLYWFSNGISYDGTVLTHDFQFTSFNN
tara:strand:+ start:3065 stop:4768 length:1704 start_codon:yes stop_codon:yes gene_type:complete